MLMDFYTQAKLRAGIWKSMVTTASLGMTGDLLAQSIKVTDEFLGTHCLVALCAGIGRYKNVKELQAAGKDTSDVPLMDFKRFFKMATFGFFYYGPLQGVWYPALDKYGFHPDSDPFEHWNPFEKN
eukprot:4059749-Pyramimonas_sp.AAC.1